MFTDEVVAPLTGYKAETITLVCTAKYRNTNTVTCTYMQVYMQIVAQSGANAFQESVTPSFMSPRKHLFYSLLSFLLK